MAGADKDVRITKAQTGCSGFEPLKISQKGLDRL